jgi:hypothetical protein
MAEFSILSKTLGVVGYSATWVASPVPSIAKIVPVPVVTDAVVAATRTDAVGCRAARAPDDGSANFAIDVSAIGPRLSQRS